MLEKWSSEPQNSSLPLHLALQAANRPMCMKIKRLIQTIQYRVLGLPILMPSPPVSPSPFLLRTIPNSDPLLESETKLPAPSNACPAPHSHLRTPTLCGEFPTLTSLSDPKPSSSPSHRHAQPPTPTSEPLPSMMNSQL